MIILIFIEFTLSSVNHFVSFNIPKENYQRKCGIVLSLCNLFSNIHQTILRKEVVVQRILIRKFGITIPYKQTRKI